MPQNTFNTGLIKALPFFLYFTIWTVFVYCLSFQDTFFGLLLVVLFGFFFCFGFVWLFFLSTEGRPM